MFKKTAWIALFCAQSILSQAMQTPEQVAAELAKKAAEKTFNDTLLLGAAAYSTIKIGRTVYKVGQSIIPKTSVEETRTQAIKNEIQILKTEADFKRCLVTNALVARQEHWFPKECKQQANLFSRATGIEACNSIKHEFVTSSSKILAIKAETDKQKTELEKSTRPGMSTTKKVVISGLVVSGGLVVGTFWWLGVPAVTAKLIAAKGVVTTVTAVAIEKANEAASNISPSASIKSFVALEREDKFRHVGGAIIGTAGVIENVEFATNMIYTSDEEQLINLRTARQTQPPLFDRMKSAHINDPK